MGVMSPRIPISLSLDIEIEKSKRRLSWVIGQADIIITVQM